LDGGTDASSIPCQLVMAEKPAVCKLMWEAFRFDAAFDFAVA